MSTTCTRYHDFSCGHRVVGHEGACAKLHGHNYRVHFTCRAEYHLDSLGRVVDFSVIKSRLCQWLEDHWDHRMLLYKRDPYLQQMPISILESDVEIVDFNPTAENMAEYLLHVVGPRQLNNTDVTLAGVVVEETRKCQAEASL